MRAADRRSSTRIIAATSNPAVGSAHRWSNAAPKPAATTASEVRASVRAWWPSETSACDPIRRPTRMR